MPGRPRRPPSLSSSVASSQQHILADRSRQGDMLEPPNAPFANGGSRPISDVPSVTSSSASLSVNYIPNKFSNIASSGLQKRRSGTKGPSGKTGGGREAFRSNEARMPDANDDDYDGVDNINISHMRPSKLRWNRFKWILFSTNLLVTIFSLICLISCILTWLNVWFNADIVRVGNTAELTVSTVASIIGVATSLLGWAGILLNNRGFLAVYNFLLWVLFAFICAPGYMTYKKRTFNLEGKINAQWSRDLGMEGRARVQNQLHCCGYYSPFVEATVTNTCYARSVLPGCKNDYLKFEKMALERWYTIAFSLVPLQLAAILAALLCSNHVTYRWGKGMMPKAYRLDMSSMALIIDNYASQLADRLGKHGGSGSGTSTPAPGYAAPVLIPSGHAQYASLSGGSVEDYGKKM